MLLFSLFVLVTNVIILVATVISCRKTVEITNDTIKTCEEINQRLDHLKKLRS